MDIKQVKDLFSKREQLGKQIDKQREQAKYWEERATQTTYFMSDVRVQTSKENKQEKAIIMLAEANKKVDELLNEYERVNKKIFDILDKLYNANMIENKKYYDILSYKYKDGMNLFQIALKYGENVLDIGSEYLKARTLFLSKCLELEEVTNK